MDKFERLNWETRNYRNKMPVDHTKSQTSRVSSAYFDYLNNQTYKANNGKYPDRPY